MSAVSLTKLQRGTLNTLRGILRQIRDQYDVRPSENVDKRDVSAFTNFVMQQYRTGSKVTDRTKAKALRTQAQDFLVYLEATKAQASLVAAYRGVDPDKPVQRHAAARFVGLTMPENVPLGTDPSEVAEKYDLHGKLQAMAAQADFSKLTGIDNIRAQYYGIEAATGISVQQPGANGQSKGQANSGKPGASSS